MCATAGTCHQVCQACLNEDSYVKDCRSICLEGLRRTTRSLCFMAGLRAEDLENNINRRPQLLVVTEKLGVPWSIGT
jgi:hypothetical protein